MEYRCALRWLHTRLLADPACRKQPRRETRTRRFSVTSPGSEKAQRLWQECRRRSRWASRWSSEAAGKARQLLWWGGHHRLTTASSLLQIQLQRFSERHPLRSLSTAWWSWEEKSSLLRFHCRITVETPPSSHRDLISQQSTVCGLGGIRLTSDSCCAC